MFTSYSILAIGSQDGSTILAPVGGIKLKVINKVKNGEFAFFFLFKRGKSSNFVAEIQTILTYYGQKTNAVDIPDYGKLFRIVGS